MDLETVLIRDEGLRHKIYFDSGGVPTIGVGRNLLVGITTQEALYLLQNDVNKVRRELRSLLPWYDRLSEPRKIVLESMAFNLGTHGLLKFTKTLEAIEAGRYADAADLMLQSKWATQVHKRALRLSHTMRLDRVI